MMELLIRKNKKKRICKSSTPNVSSFFNHGRSSGQCLVELQSKRCCPPVYSPEQPIWLLCQSDWRTVSNNKADVHALIFSRSHLYKSLSKLLTHFIKNSKKYIFINFFFHSLLLPVPTSWQWEMSGLYHRGPVPPAKSNMFAFLRSSPFCCSDPRGGHKYPTG